MIVSAPAWKLSGVNIFSANLVRGLRAAGWPARLLLTEQGSALVDSPEAGMPLPPDLPMERLEERSPPRWGSHWRDLHLLLEASAPCVYVVGSDWRHSCISPLLTRHVAVVGVVHSDDPLHYDHARRLGRFWDAMVATTDVIAAKTAEIDTSFRERLTTIPIGVRVPSAPVRRACQPQLPLRVLYHGVLAQRQKRVLDLPRVIDALVSRKVGVELTVVGGGPDEPALRAACERFAPGVVRFRGVLAHDEIPDELERADAFILTSGFEGLPNALLEAMASGCVPVASKVRSGAPGVVRDGHNGFLVEIGDIGGFADRLERLGRDRELRERLGAAAVETVRRDGFTVEEMTQAYARLFGGLFHWWGRTRFRRPRGSFAPPPQEVAGVPVLPGDYRQDVKLVEQSELAVSRLVRLLGWRRARHLRPWVDRLRRLGGGRRAGGRR